MEKGWKTPARRAFLKRVASQYQQASAPHKKQILAHFVSRTGYVRKYAVWVLNHAEEVLQAADGAHQRFGPEVQQALVLAWETLNRVCAKRLIAFLPDIIAALEQHGHLHLSEENRRILLSMSAATADRLLRFQRSSGLKSLSATKAGPLLKHQIPIRTFADWNEAQPGFLEVDLVAHCGPTLEGSFLYTLTLTDVATGWTECLPLLNRGREEVLAALQRARTLIPFPVLGIDTDNGGEFINEDVAAYCEREQITFTRGRPYEKRDQCFIEQKNRVVVRQVVGRARYAGEHAARQLTELYRALRLYVNCFQPSMKLLAKKYEGRNVRRVYDLARTPLQRLLLSGVLPETQQQELKVVARALDPLRLFQQLQQLQHAFLHYAVDCFLVNQASSASPLLVFEAARCTTGLALPQRIPSGTEGTSSQHDGQEVLQNSPVLNWRRTSKDPFAGQWELILFWMQADPTLTSGEIFRMLQAQFPGRYQPLQVRTLQRGMRKIRAHLLLTREEPWQHELIHGKVPTVQPQRKEPDVEHHSVSPLQPADSSPRIASTRSCSPSPLVEGLPAYLREKANRSTTHASTFSRNRKTRAHPHSHAPARWESDGPEPGKEPHLTIEQAISAYLAHHRGVGHTAKTLEWHQTALSQLQHYLLTERHLRHIHQITEMDLHGWCAFLAQNPTRTGKHRARSTIETYARSAWALCAWLVQRGELPRSFMDKAVVPRSSTPLPPLVQPETFEQLVQAAFPPGAAPRAKKMVARDRAVLWVLFETGITVSEMCSLRVSDLDQQTGMVRVRGKKGKERQVVLGHTCLEHLRSWLKFRAQHGKGAAGKNLNDRLFCTVDGHPLSKNSLTWVFHRLRVRAEMDEITISPQLLRHSFALRYLQAGGNAQRLQELFGYESMVPVKQYLRWHDQLLHHGVLYNAEKI